LSKLGQIQTEVFVYILAFMIVAFVMIYGYSAVRQFQDKTAQVDLLTFKNTLENTIDSYASDYGSTKKLELKVPNGFEKICFVNTQKDKEDFPQNNLTDSSADDYDPIITSSWGSDDDSNIFLIDGLPKFILNVPTLSLPDNVAYECIELESRILVLWLKGQGDSTLLSTNPI
jgi:hypothetical protein